MKLIIHTDGGARGNPGPAAIGVVIETPSDTSTVGREIRAFGKKIGETTNNVAEYSGVIEALLAVKSLSTTLLKGERVSEIGFYLDSTLVVNQLNGLFQIKQPHLRALLTKVRVLESETGAAISYTAVPREQNSRADFFVNQALDR